MKGRARLIVAFLAMFFLNTGNVHAQSLLRSGKIVDFEGSSAEYTVRREGRNLPVAFNMALVAGDQIVVGRSNQWIQISYVDGGVDTVTARNSPFRIERRPSIPTRGSNYLRDLWDRVTRNHDDGLSNHVIRDSSRLALLMPGLADGSARITAGDRHFMLGWSGGPGPYRVVVRNARGDTLIDEAALPTRQLIIGSRTVRFEPGSYTVEVSTGTQRVSGGFLAAPAENIPTGTTTQNAEGAVEAAEQLVEKGNAALLYEAYLQLYPGVRNRYAPARAFADYLLNGAPR